ncbi:MAG: hypothetical protein ACP5NP_03900, partial [Acetobacteraceae bacterium]
GIGNGHRALHSISLELQVKYEGMIELADRIRIEVGSGHISYEDVAVLFFRNGREGATITPMTVNKRGGIVGAPEDFRAFFLQEHSRLLGL